MQGWLRKCYQDQLVVSENATANPGCGCMDPRYPYSKADGVKLCGLGERGFIYFILNYTHIFYLNLVRTVCERSQCKL